MFVAKWNPGPIPQKTELTSAPVCLELRHVPHQFFNEEGFEHITGLVGESKGLHPSTANMTNLEVAKVFTIIDPRKPLPEAVNVQFDSGEICRILVSSPWMPPVCSFCKEVGHSLKHCKSAPVSCNACKSTCHTSIDCPRVPTKRKSKPQQKKAITGVLSKPLLKGPIASQRNPDLSVKGMELAAVVDQVQNPLLRLPQPPLQKTRCLSRQSYPQMRPLKLPNRLNGFKSSQNTRRRKL